MLKLTDFRMIRVAISQNVKSLGPDLLKKRFKIYRYFKDEDLFIT